MYRLLSSKAVSLLDVSLSADCVFFAQSFETGDEVVRRLDKADGFNVLSEIPKTFHKHFAWAKSYIQVVDLFYNHVYRENIISYHINLICFISHSMKECDEVNNILNHFEDWNDGTKL